MPQREQKKCCAAVARQRIFALQELDAAHLRHDHDGAAHAAVRAGAAADRTEAVAERRLETHRAAMALASPNGRVVRHVASSPVRRTPMPGRDERNGLRDLSGLTFPHVAALMRGTFSS